jgi:hypothetical protein
MKEIIVSSFYVFIAMYIAPSIFELTHNTINSLIHVGDVTNNYHNCDRLN